MSIFSANPSSRFFASGVLIYTLLKLWSPWNPPTRSIITIACDNDADDSLKLPNFDSNDNNVIVSNDGENPHADNDNKNNFVPGENQNENNDIISFSFSFLLSF